VIGFKKTHGENMKLAGVKLL